MDRAEFLHILQKLDKLLDYQRDHETRITHLLEKSAHRPIPEAPETKQNLLTRLQKLPLHWQWITGGVVSWGISASISSYLSKGGDPVKLLETLVGLFISVAS